MRRIALLCGSAVIMAACGPKDTGGTAETTQAMGTMAGMIHLADVAGKWTVKAMPEMGDSVLTTYELVATADTTGWMVTFPGREPLPVHVMPVMGDSIVTHVGPYESVLRKGVMVTTTTVSRLVDGKLMGTFTARYTNAGADSVMMGRTEAIRM